MSGCSDLLLDGVFVQQIVFCIIFICFIYIVYINVYMYM